MSDLPRRKKSNEECIVVDVGDFSSDRLYPDLNPEFFDDVQSDTEDDCENEIFD